MSVILEPGTEAPGMAEPIETPAAQTQAQPASEPQPAVEPAEKPKVYDVIVIGAGASGIATAVRLQKEKIGSFLLLEKTDGLGGTWYENVYPGLTCDVPSHVYSFSFEPNPNWSRTFSPQAEILEYMREVAEKYDVPRFIEYNSTVESARWDDDAGNWVVTVKGGRVYRARFLFNGAGGLERPKYPVIEGIERYRGASMHSARWGTSYDFRGKRVAVIGNAASGVQLIPHVQRDAEKLTIFMRSANWVLPKPDRQYHALEHVLLRALPFMPRLYRGALFMRQEALHSFFRLGSVFGKIAQQLAIGNIKKSIKDPELVAALTPDYPIGCKRILMSNDFFPALAQPNVEIVRQRIASATETGLVDATGVARDFDVIIFATGFDVFNAGVKIEGLGGMDIETQWLDGPEAYKSINISEMPNLFYLLGPNSALGHNSVWLMIEAQVKYAIRAIKEVRARGDKYLVVRRDAMNSYNRTLQQKFHGMVWSAGCQGWYKTKDGRVFTLWPGNVISYRKEMQTFDLRHYDFVKW